MKLFTRLALGTCLGVCCFGASLPLGAHNLVGAAPLTIVNAASTGTTLDQWPGGNRTARKITRKSRRRTFLKTRGSALKTMFARKKGARKFKKASKQGFNKADKSAAPPKKAGCHG